VNPLHWHDAAAFDDLWDGAGAPATVHGHEVALFRIGDAVFATGAICTHGQANLCDGYVEGHEVECPLHQGRFDLRTGAPTCAPVDRPIAVYPVKIEGGRVFIAL
jgi:naphthalene 1,2-dioxygenase ferredoxin component